MAGAAIRDVAARFANTDEALAAVHSVERLDARRRRTWMLVAAAAAVVAIVASAAVVLRAGGDPTVIQTDVVTTLAEPSPQAPPTTLDSAITSPPSAAPQTTERVLPIVPPTTGVADPPDCTAATVLSPAGASMLFLDSLVAARTTGDFTQVAGCIEAVPGVFDERMPNCWLECTGYTRTFGVDRHRVGEFFSANDLEQPNYRGSVPVTYRSAAAVIDVGVGRDGEVECAGRKGA